MTRWAVLTSVAITAAFTLAACGSSSSSSASNGTSGSGSPGKGADVAAAQAAIAPYTGHPSSFPVEQPLGGRLPANARIVYLQCGSPTCALIHQLLAPAVKTIGVTMTAINAGNSAASSQAAASSALSEKPAAVILPAVTPSIFGDSLNKINSAGIKITAGWVTDPKPYGITASVGDRVNQVRAGRLMADWVIVHKGAKADVVFYTTPELGFSAPMQQGFATELAKNCSTCTLRTVPLSVTTFGSTAPHSVVSDLQAHSGTNTAVFASYEAAIGLPPALKSAGLSITTLGFAPDPENLQDLRSGGLTAALGFDLPVQIWTIVDATARQLLGKPVPAAEADVPMEFLTKQQITFDPSNGWTGYPDFPQRFAKLWTAK